MVTNNRPTPTASAKDIAAAGRMFTGRGGDIAAALRVSEPPLTFGDAPELPGQLPGHVKDALPPRLSAARGAWVAELYVRYPEQIERILARTENFRMRLVEVSPIRAKWTMDEATSLADAAQRLREYAVYLDLLAALGFELEAEVADDYGHLRRVR